MKKSSKLLVISRIVRTFATSYDLYGMSKQEKEEKAKEFWKYYEATQGSITIVDPVVLD